MRAIVTGGTKGIGKAIACKLAAEGYDLAVCARSYSALEALKTEFQHYGIEVLIFVADCSVKQEVLDFCSYIQERWSKIDVLVNNVGMFSPNSFLEEEDKDFESMLNINLLSTYYLSKRIGNQMKNQGFGHIFNIVSVNALTNQQQGRSYGVTKSAMLSLNNVTREQLTPFKVKVTAIIPGETLTNSWEGTTIPEDQFVKPEEIAEILVSVLKLGTNTQVDEIVLKPLNFNL